MVGGTEKLYPTLFFLYFSFMLVGDPFAGKTKVLNVLAQTLTLMTERGHGDENINKVPDSQLICQ